MREGLFILGFVIALCGLAGAWLEKTQYAQPFGGRFGQAANGASVTIGGAFLGAVGLFEISIPGMVIYLAALLGFWLLIGVMVERKGKLLKGQLEGKYGTADTDFRLTNTGLAYGKISVNGKSYRAYMNRMCKNEGEKLPEFIPGQVMEPTEAQRNLDTMAEMQTNPISVKKGEKLCVSEICGLALRVAFPK